jgi:hypothetical protein
MTDAQARLKACPFCGAEQGARKGGPKLMVSDSGQGWTVRCTSCLARASNVFLSAEAIAAWNTRTPDAQPSSTDEVERLAYTVANSKLGEGPAVRCEGPTEFEIDQARQWVRRVLAAMVTKP